MPVYLDSIIGKLSIRTGRVLERQGITMLEELTFYTEDEMLKWKNMGRKSVKELRGMTIGWDIWMGSNSDLLPKSKVLIHDMYVQFGEGLPEECRLIASHDHFIVAVNHTNYKYVLNLNKNVKTARWDWTMWGVSTYRSPEPLYRSTGLHDPRPQRTGTAGSFTTSAVAERDFRIFCDEMRKVSKKTEGTKKIRKLEKIEGWTVGEVGIKDWTLEKELGPTPPPMPRTSDSARYMLFIQAKAARDGTDQLTLKLARIPSWDIDVEVEDIGSLARAEVRGMRTVRKKVGVVNDRLQAPWHYGDPKDWRAAVKFAASWANNEIIKHDRLEAKTSPKKKGRPTQRQLEQSMREATAKRQTGTQRQEVIYRQFGTCKRCRVCLAFDANRGCCTVCGGSLSPNPKRRRRNPMDPLRWFEGEGDLYYSNTITVDGNDGNIIVSKSDDEWLLQFMPLDAEKDGIDLGEAPTPEEAKDTASAFYMARGEQKAEVALEKTAKKKARKKRKKHETLIGKSRRLWDSYVEKPTKRGLKSVLKHLEDMEKSTGSKVKQEWRKAKRAAKAEAKEFGMLIREKPKKKKAKRKKRS